MDLSCCMGTAFGGEHSSDCSKFHRETTFIDISQEQPRALAEVASIHDIRMRLSQDVNSFRLKEYRYDCSPKLSLREIIDMSDELNKILANNSRLAVASSALKIDGRIRQIIVTICVNNIEF